MASKLKKRIAVSLVVVLSVVCLVLPLVVGHIAENKYRDSIDNINTATAGNVTVLLRKYDRGWFTSDTVVDVEYMPQDAVEPVVLTFHDQVAHGPLPWRSWTADNTVMASSSPGVATMRNTIKLSLLTELKAEPALPDLTVQTRVGFAGNTITHLRFPAYKGRINVQGFDLDIDTSGVSLDLDTENQGEQVKWTLHTEKFNVERFAELQKISVKGTWNKANKLDSVLAPVQLDAAVIKVLGGAIFDAEKLQFSIAETTDTALTREVKLSFAKLNARAKREWRDGDIRFTIDGLVPSVMQKVRPAENRMWGGRLGPHFIYDYRLGLDEHWPNLFTDGAKISLQIAKLTSSAGNISGGVTLDPKTADKHFPADDMLRKFSRDASFTISKPLIDNIYYQRDMAKAGLFERFSAERQQQARERSARIVQMLARRGLLTDAGDNYETRGFKLLFDVLR